jgi:hypothetical protein
MPLIQQFHDLDLRLEGYGVEIADPNAVHLQDIIYGELRHEYICRHVGCKLSACSVLNIVDREG